MKFALRLGAASAAMAAHEYRVNYKRKNNGMFG